MEEEREIEKEERRCQHLPFSLDIRDCLTI